MKRQAKIELFLSDARGIYIPRDFADSVIRSTVSGINHDDLDYLSAGPDGEHYWETWVTVCDCALLTAPDGTEYRIHQDGDCWLVEDGAEFDESSEFDLGMYINDGTGYTAPSAWASYLINGDASGIDDSERLAADAWVKSLGFGPPVTCEDAGFVTYHDAREFLPQAADCQRYGFMEDQS